MSNSNSDLRGEDKLGISGKRKAEIARDQLDDAQIDDDERKKNSLTTPAASANEEVSDNKFSVNSNTNAGFGQLPAEQFDAEYLRLIKADIANARAHRHELPDEAKRGLSDATIDFFDLGYLPDWVVTYSRAQFNCGLYVKKDTGEIKKLPPASRRIIIPTDDGEHFNAVALPSDRKRIKKDFWKQHAGTKQLFGDKKSVADADIVIVVEGEFDCMSIWQATNRKVAVVAILGCGNWKKTLLPNLSTLLKSKQLILLFDADDGRESSNKLRAELTRLAVPAVSRYLYDEISLAEGKSKFGIKVDANDILRLSPADVPAGNKNGEEFLKTLIERIIDGAREELTKAENEIRQQTLFNNANASSASQSTRNDKAKLKNQSTVGEDAQPKKSVPVVTAEITNIARAALNTIPVAKIPEPEWTKIIWSGISGGLTLEELDKWSRNDSRYDAAAVKDRFDRYKPNEGWTVKYLIEVAKRFGFNENTAQIHSLKIKLSGLDKEISDFDNQKVSALEKLRDAEKFDSETVFADEIVTAAAFARLTEPKAFSDFKREVKIYGDKHKDEKVSVNTWIADVNNRVAELESRHKELLSRRNKIQAQIDSLSFVGEHDLLKSVKIPPEYSISSEFGIEKLDGDKVIPVCRRPVVIVGKIYSVDEKIYKLVLCFQTTAGKWKKLPPTEKAIVFNRNRLIDLANSDLPVTSSNAAHVVDYLDAFNALNENNLPLSYFVNRGGWRNFNGKDYFIDPRRDTIITNADGDKNIRVKIDNSRSEFAQHLKQVGSLDKWKEIYQLAKKSPVARFMVAAAVAPPLLKILGERNFLLYVLAPTTAGKTSALYLGTSAVGGAKINRSFDATKNGLTGAAADVNDYCFPVDEKQSADNRISEQMTGLIYALGNGVGRTKLNRDSTLKEIKDWRTIAIATGETDLLPDNVTGGANTRVLKVKAPKEILPAADCKIIRETIKENYGLAFPLVIEKILQTDRNILRGMFDQMTAVFGAKFPENLPEHRRYIAVITLADALLNSALFGDTLTTHDGESIKPSDDAIINAAKIFPLIPTKFEVSDTPREKEFVRAFVGQNQNRFVGGTAGMDKIQSFYGKLKDDDGYTYVAAKALQDACKVDGIDYRKLVADLVADGFFKPADKPEKGHKTPLTTVQKKIGVVNVRCHRIPKDKLDEREENYG